MPVNRENMKLWVEALRSGEYKQGRGALCTVVEIDDTHPVGHCCLGVACEVAIKAGVPLEKRVLNDSYRIADYRHGDGSSLGRLPPVVSSWLGLEGRRDPTLKSAINGIEGATTWNDTHGATFADIADMIEYTFLNNEE